MQAGAQQVGGKGSHGKMRQDVDPARTLWAQPFGQKVDADMVATPIRLGRAEHHHGDDQKSCHFLGPAQGGGEQVAARHVDRCQHQHGQNGESGEDAKAASDQRGEPADGTFRCRRVFDVMCHRSLDLSDQDEQFLALGTGFGFEPFGKGRLHHSLEGGVLLLCGDMDLHPGRAELIRRGGGGVDGRLQRPAGSFLARDALDINPIWYGVMLMINLELALITPPVGMNLFVLKGITGAPLSQIMRGASPYVGLLMLGLFLIWAFPALSLWLPTLAGFGRF